MENNKLGLARQVCSQGKQDFPLCNRGEWETKLRDIRGYLKLFNGMRNPIKAVTFISYAEHGAFVVSLAPHTENPGNYKAVWIYVPNTAKISGDDLEKACSKAKECLLSNTMERLKDDDLFTKAYDRKEDCFDYTPSTRNNQFGIFYTNRYSLKEILGDFLYQECFSKYDAVFLLAKDGEIKVNKDFSNRVKDLSKEPLEKYLVLHRPNSGNLHGKPDIYLNEESMRKTSRVKVGDKLRFTLKRHGFDDVCVDIGVTDEKSVEAIEIENKLKEAKWKKKITLGMFSFIGEDGIQIKNGIEVKVNGHAVGNGISLNESECKEAEITIESKDYKLAKPDEKYNLINYEPIRVDLNRETKTMDIKIELANGKEADMTLKSKDLEDAHINKSKSPLKGYYFPSDQYERKENILRPTGKWMSYAIGALAMIGIEVIFLCCYQIGNSIIRYWDKHDIVWKLPPEIVEKNNDPEEDNTSSAGAEIGDKTKDKDLTNVLNYLDGNLTWDKKELDKYPETEGLFDALNKFDYDKVEQIYKENLSEQSSKLKEIVDAFSKNKNKNFTIGKETNGCLYNKEGDDKISVENYIKWLSDGSTPAPSPVASPTSRQSSSKTGTAEDNTSTNASAKTGKREVEPM